MPVAANLVATFSEPVVKGTGTVTLKRTSDNSTVESFNVASSPRLVIGGQTLTIDPTDNLAPGLRPRSVPPGRSSRGGVITGPDALPLPPLPDGTVVHADLAAFADFLLATDKV